MATSDLQQNAAEEWILEGCTRLCARTRVFIACRPRRPRAGISGLRDKSVAPSLALPVAAGESAQSSKLRVRRTDARTNHR
jgi:hypothetical protein